MELDGSTHDHQAAQNYDSKRSAFLKELGIRTLRFENEEVRKNMEGVLRAIEERFGTPPRRSAPPSSMRRGKNNG